jgi:Fe2+ or Zn2+ uptake regulation protein
VQRVDTGQGLVRYEAVGHDRAHHHHLVCDQCGTLQPFSDPELERTIRRVSQRLPVVVSDHEVVLHGACTDCATDWHSHQLEGAAMSDRHRVRRPVAPASETTTDPS